MQITTLTLRWGSCLVWVLKQSTGFEMLTLGLSKSEKVSSSWISSLSPMLMRGVFFQQQGLRAKNMSCHIFLPVLRVSTAREKDFFMTYGQWRWIVLVVGYYNSFALPNCSWADKMWLKTDIFFSNQGRGDLESLCLNSIFSFNEVFLFEDCGRHHFFHTKSYLS